MNGYFSRLINQTGIPLETGKVSAANGQNAIAPQLSSEMASMQLEETQDRQPADRDLLTGRDENENRVAGLIFPDREAENKDDFPIPPVTRTASLPIGEVPQTIRPDNPVELGSEKVTLSQDAIAPLSFPNPSQYQKAEPDQLIASKANAIIDIPQLKETSLPELLNPAEKPYPPGESPDAKNQLSDRPSASAKNSNPFPTRQVNLQTVRAWVAEPENPKLLLENLSEQELNPQTLPDREHHFPKSPNSSPQTPQNNPHHQSPITNYQPPASQNFKLTIGTISLTVEAPQPETPKPPPAPIKSQQQQKPTQPTARLNRYYIR
ncbi:MAG TPA: hypothetical protein DDZ80_00515 [Cyanobacteria bacterium UBA8803]|nr:hypothetical protein [Cyanobacteria bacterium UBA8803]